jgi:predicted outer membrane repeat protein
MVRGGLAFAGGGITTQGNDTQLTVDNCTFEFNTVAANAFTASYAAGGAVGAQGPVEVNNLTNLLRSYRPGTTKGFVVLRGSRFLHNTVAGVAASTGGAVFAGDGAVHITVESCFFVGNTVGGIPGFVTPPLICCGGAVAVQERSVLTVAASEFESNSVEGVHTCGGAACAQNGGAMGLVASRFVRNVAGGVSPDAAVANNTTGPGGVLRGGITCGGGACATNNGSIVIDRCEFALNLATGVSSGGGVCASISSSLVIADATFSHNEAGGSGGAVGVGGGCSAALTACTFVNNTASNPETGCGGAVSIAVESLEAEQPAACTIDNCSFIGNSALGRRGAGGAVYAANADLLISSSGFSANTAQQERALGGSGASWDIRNSSFTNHSPGGAIFAAGGPEAAVTGCDISSDR